MPRAARIAVIAGSLLVLVLIVVVVLVVVRASSAPRALTTPLGSPSASLAPASKAPTPTPTATPSFDKTQYSLDDPSSIWVVVDKRRPLDPVSYQAPDLVSVPVAHVYAPQLRKAASDAVVTMFAAFTAETGKQMQSQSAYRSYQSQVGTYGSTVSQLGKAKADTVSARPGFSEHQTGLAIDISALPSVCALQTCFANTPQGQWLAANAYRYGFILRYPEGLDAITGYDFEPWHYRFVGVALATEMHDTGVQTLEQFFGLPDAPDYAG